MPYQLNHIHLKSHDPGAAAEWWSIAFGFEIVTDRVRDQGDRFIVCQTPDGTRIAISGARTGQSLAPGEAGVREGLEHFGLELLEGPEDGPVSASCGCDVAVAAFLPHGAVSCHTIDSRGALARPDHIDGERARE